MGATDTALRHERDAVLGALARIVGGLAATFGPVCEVVLHDYRDPEHSVVAVGGDVTGRAVGATMSEIGLRMAALGDAARDEVGYRTRTPSGKLLKSSTLPLRDSTGAVFGALCVNVDVTAVDQAHALLGALAGLGAAPAEPPTTFFGDDLDSVIDAIVDADQLHRHADWSGLDRDQRLDLFRGLDRRGVFAVRRSVEQVARRLGISRASAYSYLAQARAARPPTPDNVQDPSPDNIPDLAQGNVPEPAPNLVPNPEGDHA
ncbi:helix-turn-helix transcriptional regulator [Streptomyces mangrovisoli]|uniref:helix-turn-helix transcriptional regulator n=1 Tax=Streptomyces mangrovisoli TaxID=1428628 RepID=UPI0006221216|nr:helix-turn-helix transcriptional regulator [Streptomyces mangrovisoli]